MKMLEYETMVENILQSGTGYRVLYIDDDISFLKILQETFEHFFFDVFVATNVRHALTLYDVYDFDLVLSGPSALHDGGIELLRSLREKNQNQVIGVVGALERIEELKKHIDSKNMKFIEKPMEYDLLMRALYELCELVCKEKILQKEETHFSRACTPDVDLHQEIEIFPFATLLIDESSVILDYNQLFAAATCHGFSHGDIFENAFISEIGYIKADSVFDWKHDVMAFHETSKVLLNLGNKQKEFFIYVNHIASKKCYMVCLAEIVKYE